jgi:hypothetical protein
LVPYKRAARHSGRANWKNRIRNIDLISVGVMLEHYLDGTSGAAQIQALHWLLDRLQMDAARTNRRAGEGVYVVPGDYGIMASLLQSSEWEGM